PSPPSARFPAPLPPVVARPSFAPPGRKAWKGAEDAGRCASEIGAGPPGEAVIRLGNQDLGSCTRSAPREQRLGCLGARPTFDERVDPPGPRQALPRCRGIAGQRLELCPEHPEIR